MQHFAHNQTARNAPLCLQIVQKVINLENCMRRSALHGPLRYLLSNCMGR